MEHGVDDARPWQQDAFRAGADAQFFVCQAPGGSGKSKLQCVLAATDVRTNPTQKQLVVVPQGHISHGFFGSGDKYRYRLEPGGETHEWRVAWDFCRKGAGRGQLLKEFLLAPPGRLGRWPTAVATHMGLVVVWSRLSERERRQAIRNLSLRVDEAHHVSGVFFDAEAGAGDDDRLATKLGEVCRFVVNADDPTAKLHLTTATFFRGDQAAILSDAVRDRFVTYSLPWDQHWPTLGIEELTIDYLNYRDDPLDLVTKFAASEPERRHLVIVPPLNRKYRDGATVEEYLARFRAVFPKHRVLDLVTPSSQERNKRFLHTAPDQFHVVLACRLFNEGTDWVVCDRLHNTDACEGSMTLAVQRFFRPLRKHPDKKVVRLYHYLPEFAGDLSDAERRKVFSDRSNAILAGVICNLELRPVNVPLQNRADAAVPLQCLYPPDQYRRLLADTMQGVLTSPPGGSLAGVLAAVRDKHGTPDGVRADDLDAALGEIARRAADKRGIRLSADRFAAPLAFGHIDLVVAKSGLAGKFFGTVNIDAEVASKFVRGGSRSLTLDNVREIAHRHYLDAGERLHSRVGYIDALGVSGAALDAWLGRFHGTTLSRLVDSVLGQSRATGGAAGAPKVSLEEIHRVIRLYHERDGVRLSVNTPWIAELQLRGTALSARLNKLGSSLAREVRAVLDEQTEVDEKKLREVIRLYHERDGTRLSAASGTIPELRMTAAAVNYKLSKRGSSLARVVSEELGQVRSGPKGRGAEGGADRDAGDDLETIHRVIRLYHSRDGVRITVHYGYIPELRVNTPALNARLKKRGTTLSKEVERALAD